MVIISDCLSEDGSSILPHIAMFLYPVSLMVRTLAFQVGNTSSILVQDAKFWGDATVVRASWNEKTKSLSMQMSSHSLKFIIPQ